MHRLWTGEQLIKFWKWSGRDSGYFVIFFGGPLVDWFSALSFFTSVAIHCRKI